MCVDCHKYIPFEGLMDESQVISCIYCETRKELDAFLVDFALVEI